MPRTAIKVSTVYSFDELSPHAKDAARSWWRQCEDQEGLDTDSVFDDVETCAGILGINIANTTNRWANGKSSIAPSIHWSGFSSQGDGASFSGDYSFRKDACEKIREHAPEDKTLHAIADGLFALQAKHMWLLEGNIVCQSSHYSHSGTMLVDMERLVDETGILPNHDDPDRDLNEEYWKHWNADEAALQQLMRDFADWIYAQLRAEYEWRMTDENVDENIVANEYEFTEDGERA